MSFQVALEELNELWADWETLLVDSSTSTIFQTPMWHHLWWQELGGQAELRITTLREAGKLVGIAPLMYRDNTLMFVGDPDLWDYHDVIMARGRDADLFPVLFNSLLQQRWGCMDLRSIPEYSSVLSHLPELARAHHYTVDVTQEDVSPGLALPSTWDDYLQGLSKKDRHELRRKLRRLEKQGPYHYYSVNGTTALAGSLDDFFTLMRDSRQDKAIFLTKEREHFFRSMSNEMIRANVLKLFFMELSGKRVASALCFDYGETRFLYNSGFRPDYSSLSVGLLLKALCLREAIEDGKRYFDFLRGNEPYKYDLGASDVKLYRLLIQQ